MKTTILQQEVYDLVGAAIEVYNEKKSGFLEDVYQECLEMELRLRGIPFVSQPQLKLFYKGQPLVRHYRPDLIVYGRIVVELKALKTVGRDEYAQVLNYLRAAELNVGYLLNLGCPQELQWKRFIHTPEPSAG